MIRTLKQLLLFSLIISFPVFASHSIQQQGENKQQEKSKKEKKSKKPKKKKSRTRTYKPPKEDK